MSGRREEQFGDGATAEEVSDQKQAGPGVPGRMPRSLPAHCEFLDFFLDFFLIIIIANNLKSLMWHECSNSHSRVCPIFKKKQNIVVKYCSRCDKTCRGDKDAAVKI